MLERQRRDVAELAVRTRAAERRAAHARERLHRARLRFLGNPVNLLLPFTAGLLGGALALYRKPPRPPERRPRDGVSARSLLATATALWSASATLRESLRAARFEPPTPPPEPAAPSASMPPPEALDDAHGGRATETAQPAPPAPPAPPA